MNPTTEETPAGRAGEESAPAEGPGPSRNFPPWGEQANPPRNGLGQTLQRWGVKMVRVMPRPLVRLAASPYIAGETRAEAWAVADRIWRDQRLHSTVDVLGEEIQSESDIEAYFQEFLGVVEELTGRPYANISVKLSALGQTHDEEACYRRTRELVEHARDKNTFVRFDMEDATTIDSTLRIYRRVRQDFDNCGIVLQTRLFRTKKDIADLMSLAPNVRLCIGIYPEAPEIALQNRDAMKEHLLELLEILWKNNQHVGIATHEEWVIRRSLELAERMGKPKSEIEVQMLLGVPRRALQQELVDQGITVRLYVPYGERWYAYSMRRLEHNPDMFRMVAGNVIGGLFRRH
jgi:proline dehydrogenase